MYDHLIVHCTGTPADRDVDAADVDRMHRQKGWSKNGYHGVITRDGELQTAETGHRCRPFDEVGAHVGGCGPKWNRRSLGVSLAGGTKPDGVTPETNFTKAQIETLLDTIEAWAKRFDIQTRNIMGHRDLIKMTASAPKACPCISIGELLAEGMAFDAYDETRTGFTTKPKRKLERGEKLGINKIYTVQNGDTLWGISRATGVRVHDIRRWNNVVGDMIQPGQELRLLN